MTGLEHFQRLKQAVLSEYRKHFPYFGGDWKSFSSQDIQNLIALIEENLRETVSEKWIYTHLKPVQNDRLPRKDMLDILSRFCGYSGWDEFAFVQKPVIQAKKAKFGAYLIGLSVIILPLLAYFIYEPEKKSDHTIKVTDQFTGKPLEDTEVKIYKTDGAQTPVEIKDGKIAIENDKKVKLVVTSPFYQKKQVIIAKPVADTTIVRVIPDDHAMMLKAFMKSDIKDWQTRKIQLDKILSDDLEVIVQLKNNLGAEAFNKKEFAQKLIIPTPSVRQMKIIEIKYGTDHKIQFIRLTQE